MAGNYQNKIRISKVCAVEYEKTPIPEGTGIGQYWALLDGGHRVPIEPEDGEHLIRALESANLSDENFFSRGG